MIPTGGSFYRAINIKSVGTFAFFFFCRSIFSKFKVENQASLDREDPVIFRIKTYFSLTSNSDHNTVSSHSTGYIQERKQLILELEFPELSKRPLSYNRLISYLNTHLALILTHLYSYYTININTNIHI